MRILIRDLILIQAGKFQRVNSVTEAVPRGQTRCCKSLSLVITLTRDDQFPLTRPSSAKPSFVLECDLGGTSDDHSGDVGSILNGAHQKW